MEVGSLGLNTQRNIHRRVWLNSLHVEKAYMDSNDLLGTNCTVQFIYSVKKGHCL